MIVNGVILILILFTAFQDSLAQFVIPTHKDKKTINQIKLQLFEEKFQKQKWRSEKNPKCLKRLNKYLRCFQSSLHQ